MSDDRTPSDTLSFEPTELERLIADNVPMAGPPGKWHAFNSIRHLSRGWAIREQDPEMASFRAITAEEESATAVFLSLKRRGYRGSENIDHRRHVNKHALTPFAKAVAKRISDLLPSNPPIPEIFVDSSSHPQRLGMEWRLVPPDGTEVVVARPRLPLSFVISEGEIGGPSQPIEFMKSVFEVTEAVNRNGVMRHLRKRANVRNTLLYAASEGYPIVKKADVESGILEHRRNTFNLLLLFLLIDPYSDQQPFVQHCLDQFLQMLGYVPDDVEFT